MKRVQERLSCRLISSICWNAAGANPGPASDHHNSHKQRLQQKLSHLLAGWAKRPRVPRGYDGGMQPSKDSLVEDVVALFEKELKETDWGHQPC